MANVGRVDLLLQLRADIARKQLEALKQQFVELSQLKANPKLLEAFVEDIRDAEKLLKQLRRAMGEFVGVRIDEPVRGLRREANQAASSINELRRSVQNLREFNKAGLFPKESIAREIQQANAAIRTLGGETRRTSLSVRSMNQEFLANAKTIQNLKSQYNTIATQFGTTGRAAQQLSGILSQITKLGGNTQGLVGFEKQARAAAAGVRHLGESTIGGGRAAGFFSNILAAANNVLGKFGLTTRDVSLLLGTGFLAGSVAGVIRLFGQMVVAVTKAIFVMAQLGSALTRTQNIIKNVFDDSANSILEFANNTAIAFGITEQAALTFTGKIGRLFQSFGVGARRSSEFAEGLLSAAQVLRATSPEFIAADDALRAVFDTVAGNIEGLRRFDIFLTEVGLQSVAARNGIENLNATLDNTQRSLLAQIATLEQAKKNFEDFRKAPEDIAIRMERLRAVFTDVISKLGQELAPFLEGILKLAIGFVVVFTEGVKSIKLFIDNLKAFAEENKGVTDFLKVLGKIADIVADMVPGLRALRFVMGILGDTAGEVAAAGEEATEGFFDFDKILEDINEALDGSIDSLNAYNESLGNNKENLEKLRDAHLEVAKAIEEAAEAEAEARLQLARVREDSIAKAADAQRDLREAEQDAEEQIFDARRKRHDVQIQNFRAVRDAEEKLKEARIDSAKKVDDAERALADARRDRFREIINSQISLEEALFQGDVFAERRARLQLLQAKEQKSVRDAALNLEEERANRAKEIAEAERNLEEARFDASRRLQDANRALARTVEESAERIAEAHRKLHETEVQINRALYDAAQRVTEAMEDGRDAIADAREEVKELNEEFGTTDLTLGQILDKLERIRVISQTTAPGGAADLILGGAGFAHGGHFPAGRPRMVGEKGIELEIPHYPGAIVSNADIIKALQSIAGKSGGSSGGNTIIVNETVDGQATAAAVINRMVLEGMA